MTEYISANFNELLKQASMTAHDYLCEAVDRIDRILGDGAARKHPELIAAFMQTAALDLGFATLAQQLRAGLDACADAYDEAGGGLQESFTVRKISYGEGVERVFPVHSPMIDSIKVVRTGKVRRAKLYYLRDRRGKSARIAERQDNKPAADTKSIA